MSAYSPTSNTEFQSDGRRKALMRSLADRSTPESLRIFVRRIAAATVFYSGMNALYRFLARRNEAIVLMYHRVVDQADLVEAYVQPGMYVTTETFDMHMQHISQQYHVVPLAELVESLRNGIRRNTCVITFDDGWKDSYTHAFPILKKYNLPATVFLVSDYTGTNRWFWPERVSLASTKYLETKCFRERSILCPGLERIDFFKVVSNSALTPSQKIDAIINHMKSLERGEREAVIRELEELVMVQCKEHHRKRLTLSWREVKEMSEARITFGSHTKSDVILTKVSKTEAREETAESKQQIEKLLARTCSAFSYPNGNWDGEIREMLTEHYDCAFTTETGFVKPGDDPFCLKRIAIHNDIAFTKALFACRLSGF